MKKYCVFFILVAAFLLLSACGGTKAVDLSDYTTVEYTGMDGRGRAQVNIRYEDIATAVLGKVAEEDAAAYDKLVFSLKFAIDTTWEQDGSLSNGDTLSITYTMDETTLEELGVEVKSGTASFAVAGLQEPIVLDAFLDVKIFFENYAPCVTATVVNNSTHEFLRNVRYTLDQTTNLDNGDTVVVTAEYSIYEAESQGYVLDSDTAEYVVENMPAWVTSAEQVDNLAREALKKQAEDLVVARLASISGKELDTALTGKLFYAALESFTYETPQIIGEYLLTKKDPTVGNNKTMNEYVYIFEVPVVITVSRTGEVVHEGTAYFGVQFSQMTLSAENIINPNVKSGSIQLLSPDKNSVLNYMVISKIGEYAMSEFS